MAEQVKTEQPEYEPPVLAVLGKAHTLTLGPVNGEFEDATFPHPTGSV